MTKRLWNKDKFLVSLDKKINNVKILSLDIFDTLIFRKVKKPTDVFYYLGEKAEQEGLLYRGLTPMEFQQIRIIAEQEAKKSSKVREVTLKEIYNHMPDNMGEQNKIKDLEVQCEKELSYLNPSIVSLIETLKEKGTIIALLTDMYLSSDHIKNILEYNGFDLDLIDTLLVSNEEGDGKSSGYLFKRLLKLYPQISKEVVLHIGDNKSADIDGAEKIGIKSIHYNIIPPINDTIYEAEQIRHGSFFPELYALRKLANSLNNNLKTDQEKSFYEVGASVLGPFLSAFSDWIVDICIREGKKAVYPFMREGKLLAELIKNSAQEKLYDLKVEPVYVSRQSTVFAAMKHFGQEEVDSLFDRKHVTISGLFDMLNLPEGAEVFSEHLNVTLRQSKNIKLNDTGLRVKLKKYLLDDRIRKKVEKEIEKKRELLINYLLQTAEGSLDNIVMVDLGFSGTISYSIELALKNTGIESKITHLLGIGEEKTKYRIFAGLDLRGFVGSAGENLDLIRPITKGTEVFDQLMMAGLNTTKDYKRKENGRVEPVTEENIVSDDEIKLKKICHQGILNFQQLWFYLKENSPLLINSILKKKRELCMLLHRLKDMPTYNEAVYLGNLHHDDNMGSYKLNQICTDEDMEKLKEMGIEEFHSFVSYGYDYTNVRWGQAVLTRHDPSFLYRYYLERNNIDGYLSITSSIMRKIKMDNVNEVVIYGAGDLGLSFLRAARLYNIDVCCFVDRKDSLWGQYIDNIEVVSLDTVVNDGKRVFVIGSLAFIEEIRGTIEEKYRFEERDPIIFSA